MQQSGESLSPHLFSCTICEISIGCNAKGAHRFITLKAFGLSTQSTTTLHSSAEL
jgi:hypothetical protein